MSQRAITATMPAGSPAASQPVPQPGGDAPRPRGRRRASADLDVRERLLECATQLFADQGIAATTMAQIAAAAGVTSAMVHYYFTNREKLLDAVVEERIATAIEFVWAGTDSAATEAHALVQDLVARLFDVTARLPWLPALWLREIVNEGGLLRERALRRLPVGRLQQFAQRISVAQRDGAVNPALDAQLLFTSIIALVMLPLATAKVWQSTRGLPRIERDALQRHVTALVSAALQVPPPPAKTRARRDPGNS